MLVGALVGEVGVGACVGEVDGNGLALVGEWVVGSVVGGTAGAIVGAGETGAWVGLEFGVGGKVGTFSGAFVGAAVAFVGDDVCFCVGELVSETGQLSKKNLAKPSPD